MRKLSIVLLILGAAVGLSPVAGQLYTRYEEYRMMNEWMTDSGDAADEAAGGGPPAAGTAGEEDASADPEEALHRLQEVFAPDGAGEAPEAAGAPSTLPDGSAAAPQEPEPAALQAEGPAEEKAKAENPASRQKVLGIIRIEKIKVNAPIVEGVKASNLKAGVGHIPGTAALGEPGNSALAGHRSYTFGKFFNRLDELEPGDEILIITKKEELKYRVYKKLVVKPDDVSVLEGDKDRSIITLITCTPIYVASHRLIVHAGLEEKPPE